MLDALIKIATLIINTLGGMFLLAVLLRFLLQVARADFYNPISQSLVRVTNLLVKPLRRVIPGFFGIDFASLLLAVLIKLVMIVCLFVLQTGGADFDILRVIPFALLSCLVWILNIYFIAMLATIIMSWVAAGSYHPAVVLTHQIAEPVMAPFRRLLPAMGGIDFSPMLAFLAINVVKILFSGLALKIGLHPYSMWGLLILDI
jgi:YggT family protein